MYEDLKIAIVSDWMLKPGGADRLLISMLKVFPNADIYTSIYFKDNYTDDFSLQTDVKSTFLQRLPFKNKLARHYNVLTPLAFENLDMSSYDLIISLSAGPAKGIIPSLHSKHLAIILTPPRYLWDKDANFRSSRFRFFYRFITPFISTYLRIWDRNAIQRADVVISISNYIQGKVRKYYNLDSEILYPGVSDYWFEDVEEKSGNYFLCVSRLYDYKRIDWAIEAAQKANVKLKIVGKGPDEKFLKKCVDKSDLITFLGHVSDQELRKLYSSAQALIFPGIEDYGYVPIESMASGTPVLGLNEGGVFETIEEGVTGEFFEDIDGLYNLIKVFDKNKYNRDNMRKYAQKFSEEEFHNNLKRFVKESYER